MELLTPARITSLGSQVLRVIYHKDAASTEEFALENVYPFETVYNLKQRLAIKHRGDKNWLPNGLFVAQAASGGKYTPVEFKWSFAEQLDDPFLSPGTPNTNLWVDDGATGLGPAMLSGANVETATKETVGGAGVGPATRILHVWLLSSLAEKAGFSAAAPVTDAAFEGYFKLYFPRLRTKEMMMQIFEPITAAENEVYETAVAYRKALDERLAKVEAGLKSGKVSKSALPKMRELRLLRFTLPQKSEYKDSVLELKFYEIHATAHIPFVRFFHDNDKLTPLVKLATGATGQPIISNPKLLDLFMADEPSVENGAILLLKSPVRHSSAPLGTAWTLRILQDGSAELRIGAPRKNMPLTGQVIEAAFNALPEFLAETPWSTLDPASLQLTEVSAIYDYRSLLEDRPDKKELRKRLDTFMVFFNEERIPSAPKSALLLRYKAVSNFDSASDPVLDFISHLFLREGSESVEAVPVEAYIGAVMRNFGLPPQEAREAVSTWISNRSEYILQDPETAIAAINTGTAVSITITNHPNYSILVGGAESETDLARILSLLTVFASVPSSDLAVAESPVEAAATKKTVEAVETAPAAISSAAAPPVEEEEGMIEGIADFGDFEGLSDPFASAGNATERAAEAAAEETAEAVAAAAAEALETEVEKPELLAAGEKIDAIGAKWFLTRLETADPAMFKYSAGDKGAVETYSVKCQKNANKQPFVLTPENYNRARRLYNEDVFWVEAPLNKVDLEAATLANKTVEQRRSYGTKDLKLSVPDIIQREKRALELGFGLKGDESLTLKDKGVKPEEKAAFLELVEAQKKKPLWTVVRAGSVLTRPNYYLCAKLWCIRDDLPLIPEEYAGTKYRDGRAKAKDSCPFCGGTKIENFVSPGVGETVYERNPSGKGGGKVAQYIGYPKEVYHPDGYPLPCCFVEPDNLLVPATDKAPPPPMVPLPRLQVAEPAAAAAAAAEVEAAPAAEEAAPVAEAAAEAGGDVLNRDRPFAPTKEASSAQNSWYIPNQNIVGRIATDWYDMKKGEAGCPPPAVNKLIGQDPNNFLTATKGALGAKINSYLKAPGSAFVRYSVGSLGFVGLAAFADYATAALSQDISTLKIAAPKEYLDNLFVTKEAPLVHAFEQANYGTLVHEFGVKQRPIDAAFEPWCAKVGIPLDGKTQQRPYAEKLYSAWLNFKEYTTDLRIQKDLRLYEGLLATKGLFTSTGVVLVRIVNPKDPLEPARVTCPQFGVSLYHQQVKPPLLFVVEDEATGNVDPLVLFDATSKTEKQLMAAFSPEDAIFQTLSPSLKEALGSFLTQYYRPVDGCGRAGEPVHPWMPNTETTLVPRLSTFMAMIDDLGMRVESLLRDRSNRCVGVIVRYKKKPKMTAAEREEEKERGPADRAYFYLPVVDDGIVFPFVSSLRGEEALPRPPLKALLELLIGKRYPPAPGKLAHESHFPGYMPTKIIQDSTNYLALDLRCGATVPFQSFPLTSDIAHDRFRAMVSGKMVEKEDRPDMPWDDDIALLGAPPADLQTLEETDEEKLDEAYQHLRISFSRWLNTTVHGQEVRRQIELLRKARYRLPLWELRKRLDILITPVIENAADPWITTEGKSAFTMLRRDCLQITKEKDCTGGCVWRPAPAAAAAAAATAGSCLIHTTKTARYVNPVRVMIARLVDELIRTFAEAMEILRRKVSFLRPLEKDAIMKEGDSVTFAAAGRGTDPLFSKLGYTGRKPTGLTAGLTYPEEADVDSEGEEEELPTVSYPADWLLKVRPAALGADIDRDKSSQFRTVLALITKTSIEELEARLGGVVLTGTLENWRALSNLLGVDVLFSSYDAGEKKTAISGWIKAPKPAGAAASLHVPRYLLLDLFGVPMQRETTGTFVFNEADLPATIRAWLDAHSPTA